jgi:predicted nucleic acid-binding protein
MKKARQKRKISITEGVKKYYLVDANFLVNRHINADKVNDPKEQHQIRCAKAWWKEIKKQLDNDQARVYVLDLCIAEAFKVLARKYYNNEEIFSNASSYSHAKRALAKDLTLSSNDAKKSTRTIKYHDIQTNRDIIISVDRFFEKSCKEQKKYGKTSIIDLLILATAKYLIDFYGLPKKDLYIITQDIPLYKLAKTYADLPMVFNPAEASDEVNKVFNNT